MTRRALVLIATLAVLVIAFRYHTSTAGPLRQAATPAAKTLVGEKVRVKGGMVQVRIAVSGAKVTRVDVPVYPASNRRTRRRSEQALPQLVRETLRAQSAKVAPVGGDPGLSEGYRKSLQSALDQAGLSSST